jgi:hypothetical protein
VKSGKLILYLGAVYREASRVLEKYRSHNFSSTYHVPDSLRNPKHYYLPAWNIDESNFLNSVATDGKTQPTNFAWHPMSGEMVFGPADMVHTSVVHHYGSHPFDEYVRGNVYSRGNKEVEIYGWEPQYGLDTSTTRNMSFDGQFALKELLRRLLPGWKFLVHDF